MAELPDPPDQLHCLLMVLDWSEVGGIGTAMRTLAATIDDIWGRSSCSVLSLRVPDGRMTGYGSVVAAGSEVEVPKVKKVAYVLRAVVAAWRCKGSLMVVAGHPNLAPVARLASAIAGAPYVVWIYGKDAWAPLDRFTHSALRAADMVLSITKFTAEAAVRIQRLDPSRVAIVNLCIPNRESGASTSVMRQPGMVLSVARLVQTDRYKGVDTLVRSWPTVRAHVPDATLIVVGDGDDRARLESIAHEMGVEGAIEFRGRVSDEELGDLYGLAYVFALPGRANLGTEPEGEGFGLVFIEAQAAGVPVIAGRAGGVPEAVCDGVTGLLVDPEDPQSVATAIIRLLTDRVEHDAMARAGSEFVASTFSYERFAGRIRQVLTEANRRAVSHPSARRFRSRA